MEFKHIPVLLVETLEYLDPQSGENFIDCTLGGGGHSLKILEKLGTKGKLLGIDQDSKAIEVAKDNLKKFSKNLVIVKDNFENLKNIVEQNFANRPVNGILLDLGVSLAQIKDKEYGLSFESEEPLDMRLGDFDTSAGEIINTWSEDELAEIFFRFGEEKWSKQIAQEIVKVRRDEKIKTPKDLSQVIKRIYKWKMGSQTWRIHPSTRVFQALRITVNHELENLESVLKQAVEILAPGGRLVVISFHSLEDRIVKHYFKKNKNINILTKRPIVPTEAEIENNPASRSAKLRAIKKYEL
ncbi:MAG: 16S rRNA (cytosine(1402)-N(4))-methyltransferase RsmH [Patescibacteria group bacterium]